MKQPSQYPNVPVNNYVDAVGPSVKAEFLNPTQEGLADLIGMMFGRSATCVADEFTELTYPAGIRGKLSVWAAVNAQSGWRVPTAQGQHGLLGMTAIAAGPMSCILQEANWGIGTFDFTVSLRICIDDRASLDVVATPGWRGGLYDDTGGPIKGAVFIAGNDKANWQTSIGGVLTDTGVPIVDGRYYDLQISRIAQTAYAYIDGALLVTQAYPDNLLAAQRYLEIASPNMPINTGFAADYIRLAVMR